MILPTGTRGHLNNPRGGFTLIELILVILIVSVLIGLSVPLFRGTFSGLQLKNTSLNMAKLVSYARETAIVEKTVYKLNFDLKKGKFWLTRLESTDVGGVYKRISGRRGKIFFLPDGLFFTGRIKEIFFYPDGRATRADIKITDKTGCGRLLQIKGFGGRLETEEIHDE